MDYNVFPISEKIKYLSEFSNWREIPSSVIFLASGSNGKKLTDFAIGEIIKNGPLLGDITIELYTVSW